MASRKKLLEAIWKEVINRPLNGSWIDNVIKNCDRKPDAPFADAGPVLKRLLAAGADRRDISLLARFLNYEAAFNVLYMIGDPGVDGDNVFMLHEELLTSDPSGMEGRPGSAP